MRRKVLRWVWLASVLVVYYTLQTIWYVADDVAREAWEADHTKPYPGLLHLLDAIVTKEIGG